MLPEFRNKPSLTLRGSTWDVKHLDNFLASQWGEKLFQSKKPSENSDIGSQLPFLYSNGSIRPSAAFLAQSRNQPPIQSLEKTTTSTLITKNLEKKCYTPPTVDIGEISKRLTSLEQQRIKDDQEFVKVIPPSKRRQLFEAEKHRNKVYSKLKNQKLSETKKERVIHNEYRNGILGVNITERNDLKSVTWWNKIRENDEKNHCNEEKRNLRTQNIKIQTAPSPNIQFFNSNATEAEPLKPRGLKKVDEIPQHYHNTHAALFVPIPQVENTERTQRLKELWRGNRDFDIISGSYFKI